MGYRGEVDEDSTFLTVARFKWIFTDRDSKGTNDLQSLPAASNQVLSSGNVFAIHQSLVKRAFDDDRFKGRVNDELRDHRVAA